MQIEMSNFRVWIGCLSSASSTSVFRELLVLEDYSAVDDTKYSVPSIPTQGLLSTLFTGLGRVVC